MAVYYDKSRKKWIAKGRYTQVDGTKKDYKRQFGTEQEARTLERKIRSGKHQELEKKIILTFGQVASEYLTIMPDKKSTVYTAESNINCLNRYIGNAKIDAINISYLQEVFDNIRSEYSFRYTQRLYSCVKLVLNYAYEREYIHKDPLRNSRIRIEVDESVREDRPFLELPEMLKLLDCFDEKLYQLFFKTLYFSGCRKGELIALKWKDIDFNNNSIYIRSTYSSKSHEPKIENRITTPKTKNSIRNVKLPATIMGEIKEHYDCCKSVVDYSDNWFVFGGTTILAPTTLARKLDKACDAAGIKRLTPHAFRHSQVSLLINNGETLLNIAKRMGDTTQTIEETYAHWFKSYQDSMVEKMDSQIKSTNNIHSFNKKE